MVKACRHQHGACYHRLLTINYRLNMEKRKVLRRWEIIVLVIIAFILLTALLRNFGVKVINTTEDTEMIHHTRKGQE